MKKFISILCLSLCVLFVTVQDAEAKKKKVRSITSYSVKLHCGECKAKLEGAIPFEKGVKKIDINLDTDKVVVAFDPTKTDSKKIKVAIEELDFVVSDYQDVNPGKKSVN